MIDPAKDETLIKRVRTECTSMFPQLGKCTYPRCECLGIPLDQITKLDKERQQAQKELKL